jgi:hypothetical protein
MHQLVGSNVLASHTCQNHSFSAGPPPPRAVSVRAEAGNGSGQYDYDMITIGAGSGGVRASRFATSYGEQCTHRAAAVAQLFRCLHKSPAAVYSAPTRHALAGTGVH